MAHKTMSAAKLVSGTRPSKYYEGLFPRLYLRSMHLFLCDISLITSTGIHTSILQFQTKLKRSTLDLKLSTVLVGNCMAKYGHYL